ncbi:MAG: DUF721 domain-containing protein [Bacteroidales bacterium]|nr:DUF721 domain-containing protein [Bacteroidales bacterium]
MKEKDYTIGAWLNQALHQMSMDDTATEIEVRNAYKALVGDLIVKLTWDIHYDKGVLRLRLASAALKQELLMRRDSLREQLNNTLGRNAVKQIIFL